MGHSLVKLKASGSGHLKESSEEECEPEEEETLPESGPQEEIPLQVQEEAVPINIYFGQLKDALESCTSYQELEALVASCNIPVHPSTVVDVAGIVDKKALDIKPPNSPTPLLPSADRC